MVLDSSPGTLRPVDLPVPDPGPGQVRIRVSACGVCRTDLHIIDGELSDPKLPLVPGHQVVGRVDAVGDTEPATAARPKPGDRVGVPWLGWTCGDCRFCHSGRENLCRSARFTGYTLDGGYADYMLADARFCVPLPEPDREGPGDAELAPLLCAGMIGYRAFRIATGEAVGDRIGLYGFGSAAHILCQVAVGEGFRVFAFTRPGDDAGQGFARSLGAEWAGSSEQIPPEPLDAGVVFAPVGDLMVAALRASGPGARVVSAGIHMSDIPSFPYSDLWEERSLHSVANLTRSDGEELLALAAKHRVRTTVETLPLEAAGEALERLRAGVEGSLVLDLEAG
ncbi:MAG: zinc-dependent alcohol dehydrogenase family protein [Solirubrobacterales bacterium]|nr:zinc-dependent alcohol dehydrogenase family protein [Solirubrobacterales bacterium]